MGHEMDDLLENKTSRMVDRPTHRRVLGGKWVYKLKRGLRGDILRYKAHWVVRGFEQRSGNNFNETFAAVVKPTTYKGLFAIAARNGWEIEQMDIVTAFLYGHLDNEVYVGLLTGYEQPGKIYKLNNALYGLKQAFRVWFKTPTDLLASLGYSAIPEDPSVFHNKLSGLYIATYVDDIFIFWADKQAIATLKQSLAYLIASR